MPIHVSETKEERPASNIWPPPKSKDYMKSVRDLPSNVKIGEGKKEENQSDGAKLPDDKGDNAKGEGVERREPDTSKSRHLRHSVDFSSNLVEGDHRGPFVAKMLHSVKSLLVLGLVV